MAWNITYRGKDGKQEVIQIEATDRQGVFDELARRGISAIRVEEAKGKLKPRKAASKNRGSSGLFWGVIAVGLVAVAGIVVFFVLNFKGGDETVDRKGKQDGEIIEASSVKSSLKPQTGLDGDYTDGETASVAGGTGTGLESDSQGDDLSDDDEGEAEEELPAPPKKRVFEHGSDQLIAMVTSVPEGALIPPLPIISPSETDTFIKSLDKPIVIDDDDTDAVKAVKMRVQQVREEIAKVMAENPDIEISQILNEHREIFNDNSKVRADVMADLEQIMEDGDIEGAKKYRDTMNEALQEMGISVIDMPITPEEREAAGEFDDDEQ